MSSPEGGVKKRRRLKKRQPTDHPNASISQEACRHPTVLSGLCGACGKNLMMDKIKLQHVTIKGSATGLEVNETEATDLASSNMKRLHEQQKLQLVLDIDQTLLECSPIPPPYELESIVPISLQNGQSQHWLKLRPGVREFLKDASTMFEMTLYTNGIREYLAQVAKVLDPNRELFGGRLVSTPDDNPDLKAGGVKDLTRLFPGSIEMCLILDDRCDIWKGDQKEHLLIVRPYSYFRFNAEKQPCFPPGEDRCIQLETHLKLLRTIHQQYYNPSSSSSSSSSSETTATVEGSRSSISHQSCALLLKQERSKILRGCSFAFSGIIPNNAKASSSANTTSSVGNQTSENTAVSALHKSREALWIKRLGGEIDETIIPNKTTHLITKHPNTDKVIEAVYHKIHVVHYDWLWFTVWYNQRTDERALLPEGVPSYQESVEMMKRILDNRTMLEKEKQLRLKEADSGFDNDFAKDLDISSDSEDEDDGGPAEEDEGEGNAEEEGNSRGQYGDSECGMFENR